MQLVRIGIMATAWAAGIYGGLQLQHLKLGHSICGPWGCGPPTEAVVSMHVFWALALFPLAVVAARKTPGWPWRKIGLMVAALAGVIIVVIGVVDHLQWRALAGDSAGNYAAERFLFRLATLTDLPLVQIGLIGLGVAWFTKGRGTTADPVEHPSESEDA